MANRREFLQGTIAASALPLMTGGAFAALAPSSDAIALPLYKAVFDERFAEARAFAERMRRSGTPTDGFTSDITSLWFNDLHHRWSKAPVAVAGLTAPSALFCLERLAWDYKMRVVFHAEHRGAADGQVRHQIMTKGAMLDAVELTAAGARWSDRIAGALAQFRSDRVQSAGATSVGLPSAQGDTSTTLHSWIIAPTKKTLA